MSDIGGKEVAIGLLIIGIVAMAGWVGFLYVNPVTKTETEEDEETFYVPVQVLRDYKSGLPDNWNNAPLTSSIILYNETGDPVVITLEQILEYVNKWYETDPIEGGGNEDKKDWWEKRLKPLTVIDSSGIPITGVDITELLRVFDCNFAGELLFASNNPNADKLTMDVIDITNTFDNEDDDENNIILGIAADKKWLRDSPIASDAGDFVLIGQEITYPDEGVTDIVEYKCYDLTNITVTKNWTITVKVFNNDGSPNQTLVLDAFNITDAYNAPVHYEYDNTAYWYFNATYEGTNISQIVDYTNAKGKNYLLNITFSPGDRQPDNKTNRGAYSYSKYFNSTDVENGFSSNGTHIVGNHVDYVNWTDNYDTAGTGVRMLSTNLLMCITNKIQYLYSHRGSQFNTPWEDYYNDGYAPFKLIIPGLVQSRYFNGVTGINIKLL